MTRRDSSMTSNGGHPRGKQDSNIFPSPPNLTKLPYLPPPSSLPPTLLRSQSSICGKIDAWELQDSID